MPDEGFEGMADAVRKLNEIGGANGKFMRQSLRTALREGAKLLQRIMLSVLKSQSGMTAGNIKVRAGPRSRNKISMLVGVFGGATSGLKDLFYAGFADFGHRTPHGGKVAGTEWTETPKMDMPLAEQKIAEVLSNELAEIVSKK